MLLLTGPPGSGKTKRILEKVAGYACRGATEVVLLTPTATMAEHLSNELARNLGALPAGLIQTFHRFVSGFSTKFQPASPSALRHIVRRAVLDETPAAFGQVADLPGFQRGVADLINELADASVPSFRLAKTLPRCGSAPLHAEALIDLTTRIEDRLLEKGLSTRGEHLRAVANRISEDGLGAIREVLIDGFFRFTEAELQLIRAVAEHAEVTVTLARWAGSNRAREVLLGAGFTEESVPAVKPAIHYDIVKAQNRDAEAAEVARRILDEAKAGRPFREIGVIVRSGQVYGPVFEAALARFGIPARFYFGRRPASEPAVRRIVRIVESWRKGWDVDEMLGAVRLDSATAQRDRLDFKLREKRPDHGLAVLRRLDRKGRSKTLWDRLEGLDEWTGSSAAPAVWAGRLTRLNRLFDESQIRDQVQHEATGAWRTRNAALRAFEQAATEAAELFKPGEEIPFDDFWPECLAVLDDKQLYLRDQRRNVVHVIDAMEARQWTLPVVFVCGLVEEEFPKRHSENPLLPDRTRGELAQKGIVLRTSADREGEEEYLFGLARTRGTESVALCYPVHDSKGDPTLPSFLLAEFRESLGRKQDQDSAAEPVRPASSRARALVSPPRIHAEDLLAELAGKHTTLSPSKIESFLSCPFAFFATHTLKLEEQPPEPGDRLDTLLQGTIAHDVLKDFAGADALEALLNRIFQAACAEHNVPSGYQTERIRIEMLRSLERWARFDPLPKATESRRELQFEMPITPDLRITGRIDRLDIYDEQKALVVDYKYSASKRAKELLNEAEGGESVQAGLYLIAAREHFGFTPAGMVYCALRGETAWDGWRLKEVAVSEKTVGTCTADYLEEIMAKARDTSVEVSQRIRAGELAPSPASDKPCRWCATSDICRLQEVEAERAAGGGGQ